MKFTSRAFDSYSFLLNCFSLSYLNMDVCVLFTSGKSWSAALTKNTPTKQEIFLVGKSNILYLFVCVDSCFV